MLATAPPAATASVMPPDDDLEEQSLKTSRSSAIDMAESLFADEDEEAKGGASGATPAKRKTAGFESIKSLWPSRAHAIRFAMTLAAPPRVQGSPRQSSETTGLPPPAEQNTMPPLTRSRSEGFPGPAMLGGEELRPAYPRSAIAVRFKLPPGATPLRQAAAAAAEPPRPNTRVSGDVPTPPTSGQTSRRVSFSGPVAALQQALSGARLDGTEQASLPSGEPQLQPQPPHPPPHDDPHASIPSSVPSCIASSPLSDPRMPPPPHTEDNGTRGAASGAASAPGPRRAVPAGIAAPPPTQTQPPQPPPQSPQAPPRSQPPPQAAAPAPLLPSAAPPPYWGGASA